MTSKADETASGYVGTPAEPTAPSAPTYSAEVKATAWRLREIAGTANPNALPEKFREILAEFESAEIQRLRDALVEAAKRADGIYEDCHDVGCHVGKAGARELREFLRAAVRGRDAGDSQKASKAREGCGATLEAPVDPAGAR